MEDKSIQIVCSYHKDSLIKEYSLDKTVNINLYNTSDITLSEFNINSLNKFYCEYTALIYYILNDKYSDYIGFEHYQRKFNTSDEQLTVVKETFAAYNDNVVLMPELDGNKTFNTNIFDYYQGLCATFLYTDLLEYVKHNYTEGDYPYYLFVANKNNRLTILPYMCFCISWNTYTKLMNFIMGYINYIDEKYLLNFNIDNYTDFIERVWTNSTCVNSNIADWAHNWFGQTIDVKKYANQYRLLAYIIELLVGAYLGNLYPICIVK